MRCSRPRNSGPTPATEPNPPPRTMPWTRTSFWPHRYIPFEARPINLSSRPPTSNTWHDTQTRRSGTRSLEPVALISTAQILAPRLERRSAYFQDDFGSVRLDVDLQLRSVELRKSQVHGRCSGRLTRPVFHHRHAILARKDTVAGF